MNRRTYLESIGLLTTGAGLIPGVMFGKVRLDAQVRLGGPLFEPYDDPGQWVGQLKRLGFRAAYCPVAPEEDDRLVKAYEQAARENDIVIAEVGAWSNPLSADPYQAEEALATCMAGLELADRIGANCCVNISGSRNNAYWAGPHPDNLSPDIFDLVVENTRKIIDAVKPKRTFFALEAMPWSFPDSTSTYLQLIEAIDRKQFGVHLDPVNMITSVRAYFNNGELIREMFAQLGPWVRSCHAKDITLRQDNYIPQLDELRPGLGSLDYVAYLQELAKLPDIPLMMEHLGSAGEYREAASYIRSVANSIHIEM
jgi:sugar phosphate isomerase/epimerase